MTRCVDIRLKLNDFLNERLEVVQDEQIRTHLDRCPRCVNALLNEKRVEEAAARHTHSTGDRFSARVVSETLGRASNSLFRYLCGIFVTSAFLAVASFAFVRQQLRLGGLTPTSPPWEQTNLGELYLWLSNLADSPTFHSFVLGIAAIVLSVGLILLVDLPERRKESGTKGNLVATSGGSSGRR